MIPHVQELRLVNYRGFRDARLPLEGLTFLVGRNGAGKTTLVDALSFVREALTLSPPTALVKRDGIGEVRGSVKFFVSGSIALFSRQCSKVLVISSNFSSRRLAYLRLIRLGAVRGVLSQPYSRRRAVKASITRSVSTPA
jgi:hypothetical protein